MLVSELEVAGQILNFGLVIALLVCHVELAAFVWVLYLSWIVSTTVYFLLSIRLLNASPLVWPWPFPAPLIKQLGSFGGWLQINRLSKQITNEIDRILTGLYVKTAEAGGFQIAYRVTDWRYEIGIHRTYLTPELSLWPQRK